MKILLVKTSSMGDILHTLPALTDLQQHYPKSTVDWVVEENFAQIPSWHPMVNKVIPVALRRWRKSWFSTDTRAERQLFINNLKAEQYDVIIDAQGLIKSALLIVRHARGTKHGYNYKSAREGLASLFYDIRHSVSWQQHAVTRIRQLFSKAFGYPLMENQGDYAIAAHFLKPKSYLNDLATADKSYVIFLHSTTRDEKHWPESHWIKLIEAMKGSEITIKLPWGSPHEQERAIRLASGFDYVTVLPKLTLAEVANEIAHAKAVVSVDTGLSHLTAALSKPNLTLFGPTDPNLIGGYGENQHSLISKTGQLIDLTPEEVYASLQSLLTQ